MKRHPQRPAAAKDRRLYRLKVFLLTGPITEEFAKRNPQVSRTIEIRGDQTLEDLHEVIFQAYDRWDEHLYEFQFGKAPHDPRGARYSAPQAMDSSLFGGHPAGDASRTSIGSLGLTRGRAFGYWFDFGDDWWHRIEVESISEEVPKGRYPRIVERVGESPPQYPDPEEDEEDDAEESDEEV